MKRKVLRSLAPLSLLFSCLTINNNIQIKQQVNKSIKIDDSQISVSSFSSSHGKELIIDSNYDTYWEASEKENQSVEIDLKEIKRVTSITQIFLEEDVWYFNIQGSIDGKNYFEILNNNHGEFGRIFQESVNAFARYIKLNIIKSEKGYFPSSKEFYCTFDDVTKGKNLVYGKNGEASTYSANYLPKNAFDGNSGTYYCASDASYPQTLSVNLTSLSKINSVEILLNDYGNYEFEIEALDENGNWIKVVQRNKFLGSYFSFDIEGNFTAFRYNVYSGPGWAGVNEFSVNGFEHLDNYTKNGDVYKLNNLTYIDNASDIIEYSNDGINFSKPDSDTKVFCNYIKTNNIENVFGEEISNNLLNGLNGEVSDYLDHEHLLSNITIDDSSSWKSSRIGQKEVIEYDLGRLVLGDEFTIKTLSSTLSKIELLVSTDGINFEEYQSIAGFSDEKTVFSFKNNDIKSFRFIKLEVTPKENKYAEILYFSLKGIGNVRVENWWEDTSGVIRFYPKLQKVTLNEITSRLDEFKYSGYKVIELHQPYEGLADIWAGLGGTNNYMVDPLIGTLDDLLNLLSEAHKRGMYVFMFGNVGYGKATADYFKKACKDYALGIDSKERNRFVFSDTCPDPTKWFYSDIAKAYYYGYWGENGQIPTFNFENKEWQDEVFNYIDYWSDVGFDGIALDAPNVYYFGNSNASKVTYETITKTMIKKNLFVLPEGTSDNSFISSYHYSCIQNYGLSSWGGNAFSLGLNNAQTNMVNDTDNVFKNNRDISVSLGGVAMGTMNFEDNYLNETGNNRVLEAALVTQSGHLAFLHSGSDARIGQDIMLSWDQDIQNKIHSLFGLQNSVAALNPSGHRYKLVSTNESKIYAYLKADMHNNSIVMPIFNYAIVDINYQINLKNTDLDFADGEYTFYDAFNDENVKATIKGGIMSLSSPKESYRCLVIR